MKLPPLQPGPMPSLRVIFLCVAAAVVYGVVHDQITARVCLEYFTMAHPVVIDTESPTLLGVFWGVAATWHVGAVLGMALALACRAGKWPRLEAAQLLRPIAYLLVCMGICALLSGVAGYFLTARGLVSPGEWETILPAEILPRFFAAYAAHLASYASGIVGGMILVLQTLLRRRRLDKQKP